MKAFFKVTAPKLTAAILGSVVFQIIALLIAFDLFLGYANPLKSLANTGLTGLRQYFVVSKLPEFFNSNSVPDVMLTGSSLFLYPAVRCDDKMHKRQTRYDPTYVATTLDPYSKADFFQMLLQKQSGNSTKVVNLATAGGLMSDQYAIFKKAIGCYKKPKLLIVDVAPRNFLDNNQSEPEKTPVYLVLSDINGLADLLKAKADITQLGQHVLNSFWGFYRSRTDFREVAMNYVSRVSDHPVDLVKAAIKKENKQARTNGFDDVSKAVEKPEYQPNANKLRDIASYKAMYLPVNWKSFDMQLEYFRKILELAQDEKVNTLVVIMPLSSYNLELLPAEFRDRYKREIELVTKQYGAKLADLPALDPYTFDDFEDSAHLNLSGGTKVYTRLSEIAAKSMSVQ